MNRLLITWRKSKVLTALWDGQRVVQFQAEDKNSNLRVGDIRIGRVTSYVKNIQAAFIEVLPGVNCFYQLTPNEKVKIGEEFPVVITREAVKSKMPVCTRRLTLTGRYLVLVTDRNGIVFSSKLKAEDKNHLKEIMQSLPGELNVGFIVRTNAVECTAEGLQREAAELAERYHDIINNAPYRTVYSLLAAGIPAYLTMIQDALAGSVEEIVTDIPEIYEDIHEFQGQLPSIARIPVRLYEDASYSMSNLYRIEHYLEEALNKRVWLPSGGYLVIEPTEALTVIDVNTGKYTGKKNKEQAILKIDREACQELVRQLRLRNLSGIILVDFIDLEEEENQKILYEYLKECLSHDVMRSILVDITPLHLAEITRKKVRATLFEQLREPENDDPNE